MIVLISPYGSLVNIGLRSLAACLLQAGHQTRMIFLPGPKEKSSLLLFDPSEVYDQEILAQVIELCADADLIGITVMTNYFEKARQLTETLHQHLSVPIVWGGIHATIGPEECLEYADLVCLGEGERSLVELADCISSGRPYSAIANLAYKDAEGQVILNPVQPLIQDLDTLPFPAFRPDDHHVLHEGVVQPLTSDLLRYYLMDLSATGKPVYPLMATRGCPHRCSYCANDSYADLYPHWRRVRRRSTASLLAEIAAFRHEFPFTQEIAFLDDVFVAAPTETIIDFAEQYKERIGLPFYCIVSPLTINEKKLEALLDAGLVRISMGIETGSKNTQNVYNRPIDNEAILRAVRLIGKHGQRMLPPIYDIITDNPYETIKDQLETLQLLKQVPDPYRLMLCSLVFYPGTALFQRAREEGLIHDVRAEIYAKNYFQLEPTYYNLVLYGFHRQLPPRLLAFMIHPWIFRVLNARAWAPLWRAASWLLMRLRIMVSTTRLKRFRSGKARHRQPASKGLGAAGN